MAIIRFKRHYLIADLIRNPLNLGTEDDNSKILDIEKEIIKLLSKREAMRFNVPELEEHLLGMYLDHPEMGLSPEAFEELTNGPFGLDDTFTTAPQVKLAGYKHTLKQDIGPRILAVTRCC